MEETKLAAVRSYLQDEFPQAAIDENYDFDRCAQTFRIRKGKQSLLLKVGEEFLADNTAAAIRAHLDNWKVAALLVENIELGVFVGNNPPIAFGRR